MKTTSAILLILTVANMWRAWGFVQLTDVMEAYGAGVDPMVLAGVAGGWAAVFLTLIIMLWRKVAILRWIVPIVLIVYAVWIAVQPAPSRPLTVWHGVLVVWVGWRLGLLP